METKEQKRRSRPNGREDERGRVKARSISQ